jgi:hypothetical protein
VLLAPVVVLLSSAVSDAAATPTPPAYVAWSLWLIATGVALVA